MGEDEKHLIERSKGGEIEAFEQLIEGCQKRVFNIALKMMGNYDDASELAQEVFIKVYKYIKNFKEQSTFSTWVYKITVNVCMDELRKRKNKKVYSLDEDIKTDNGEMQRQVEDSRPTPEAEAEKNETKKVISDAINCLSEEHRVVIIMRDIEGLSYDEISKILKCPEGTVKSRINRARLSLKEILKNKRELLGLDYVK